MKQVISIQGTSGEGHHERLSLMEARHRELDARLRELGRHGYLTPTEQMEASEIKKRKLLAKDAIASLRRLIA